MTGKLGLLLDKIKRQDREAKMWVVVVGIVVGILIAGGLFFGFYVFADVDEYLHETKDIINLYDFYDMKVGENETAIYIIGSSIVAESIYPPEINRILNENGFENITLYTCFLSGDTPITRSVQVQNIIDSKPSLIIYGLMPRDIGANDWREEYYVLVHDRLKINDDSKYLYLEEQLSSFAINKDIYYNKKFLLNALKEKINIGNSMHSSLDYLYDPIGYEYRNYLSSKINLNETISNINNPSSRFRIESEVVEDWTQNKEALKYIVKKFDEANIPVIVVNMPINPMLSERISNESYCNYFETIESLKIPYFNFDSGFNSEFFFDEVHMTFDGALKFAPRMADLIIEQVENDVIHYT